MGSFLQFFSIQNTFITVLGHPLSYLEFFGTLLNLASVFLVMRNNILTWPVGILGVVLFAFLFYQVQLYSDLVQQVYFLVTGFYGWWIWLHGRPGESRPITTNGSRVNAFCLGAVLLGALLLGTLMAHIHEWLPNAFPRPAVFPYLDALIAMMAFTAQLLMAHKKVECWYYWIVLDGMSVWVYHQRGIVFVALLYILFLGMASRGLWNWRKLSQRSPT
jgi:nicotinamide mononucleotide transporter